jgi:hypothetical protein
LVPIVPARPENTAKYSENCDSEGADCEHQKRSDCVSTVHAPTEAPRQSESFVKFDAFGEDLKVNFRTGFYAGLVVAVALGVWVAMLWRPERQVGLHSVHLLEQIEKREWKAVADFIDVTYQDRWGNDRGRLLERLREIFGMLPNAGIEVSDPSIRNSENRGYWTAKIRIKSTGDFAEYIESRVNSLEEPFEFEWRRGAWPWNWTLVSVRNAALEIPQ